MDKCIVLDKPIRFDDIELDTLYTLPKMADVVSVDAAQAITTALRIDYTSAISSIGLEWVTKRGTFPKRLAAYVYKTQGRKLASWWLEWTGNLVSSSRPINGAAFQITNNLHGWKAGEFGDARSCFFPNSAEARYRYARDDMERCGYLAIKLYKDGKGKGRAWILPRRDYIAVFNGYGYRTGSIARVLYHATTNLREPVSVDAISAKLYINDDKAFVLSRLGERARMLDSLDRIVPHFRTTTKKARPGEPIGKLLP